MLRIAYFILAHTQAEQLARLVTQLNTPSTHFYIHIDANTPPDEFTAIQVALQTAAAKITFIERQPCRWGGFSLVDASLRLIKTALKDGFDWGVLLSGQDYPIHSNEYISHFLANSNHAGYIDIKTPSEFDVAYRYRAWHFEKLNCKQNSKALQKSGKALQKIQRIANACGIQRKLPASISQIYAGSQWWMLTQPACQAIIDFTAQNTATVRFFRYTLVPDEMFFQTVLMHTKLAPQLCQNAMRHLEWEVGAWSPKTFKAEEITHLQHQPELFARKFSADPDSTEALRVLHDKQKRQNKL